MIIRRVRLIATRWSQSTLVRVCVAPTKAKSTPKTADSANNDDSSDDECGPNERMSMLDELAKLQGYNIALYRQVRER